ncbi:MAG: hypothetical protein WDN04_13860 [Rhodospirillales bacterium]
MHGGRGVAANTAGRGTGDGAGEACRAIADEARQPIGGAAVIRSAHQAGGQRRGRARAEDLAPDAVPAVRNDVRGQRIVAGVLVLLAGMLTG